jgi:hypothetical protein
MTDIEIRKAHQSIEIVLWSVSRSSILLTDVSAFIYIYIAVLFLSILYASYLLVKTVALILMRLLKKKKIGEVH